MFDVCLMVARGEGADVYYTELKRREDMEGSLLYHSIHREGIKRALSPSHRRASPAQSAVLQDTKRTVSTYETSPLPPHNCNVPCHPSFLTIHPPPKPTEEKKQRTTIHYSTAPPPQPTTHRPHSQPATFPSISAGRKQPIEQPNPSPVQDNPTANPSTPPLHPSKITSPKKLSTYKLFNARVLTSPSLHFTNVPKNHSKKKKIIMYS